MRRIASLVFATSLAAGAMAFTPILGGDDRPSGANGIAAPAAGETDLFNLEHVYNYDFVLNGHGNRAGQGTDLEFFTSTVVVKDAEGTVVGADGVAGNEDDLVAVERDFVVVGDHTDGAGIFDITDPENAYLASYQACPNPRNDVGVKQFTDDDGNVRTLFALSREGGAVCLEASNDDEALMVGPGDTTSARLGGTGGIGVFDITDPYAPQPFAAIEVDAGGSHNLKFHPTAPLVYIWNGELPGGVSTIQIVDMAGWVESGDVQDIEVFLGPETVGSVHDGEFANDGDLMYVASENNYEIFDNSDPRNPVRLGGMVPNPGTYAHGYFATSDGSIGITNNESLALGGFFVGGTGVCPGEGLGIYDTTIPEAPVGPLSYFVPPSYGNTDSRACTSHFGNIAPNDEVMSVAWYILGTRVVDFGDPTFPIEVAAATISRDDDELGQGRGSEAWASKTYKGPYVYVGDQERGFDIFKWTVDECVAPWMDGYDWECLEGNYRFTAVDPSQEQNLTAAANAFDVTAIDPDGETPYSCRLDQLQSSDDQS